MYADKGYTRALLSAIVMIHLSQGFDVKVHFSKQGYSINFADYLFLKFYQCLDNNTTQFCHVYYDNWRNVTSVQELQTFTPNDIRQEINVHYCYLHSSEQKLVCEQALTKEDGKIEYFRFVDTDVDHHSCVSVKWANNSEGIWPVPPNIQIVNSMCQIPANDVHAVMSEDMGLYAILSLVCLCLTIIIAVICTLFVIIRKWKRSIVRFPQSIYVNDAGFMLPEYVSTGVSNKNLNGAGIDFLAGSSEYTRTNSGYASVKELPQDNDDYLHETSFHRIQEQITEEQHSGNKDDINLSHIAPFPRWKRRLSFKNEDDFSSERKNLSSQSGMTSPGINEYVVLLDQPDSFKEANRKLPAHLVLRKSKSVSGGTRPSQPLVTCLRMNSVRSGVKEMSESNDLETNSDRWIFLPSGERDSTSTEDTAYSQVLPAPGRTNKRNNDGFMWGKNNFYIPKLAECEMTSSSMEGYVVLLDQPGEANKKTS